MHPAFSVILLTTLIGVGQGLFLAMYSAQVYAALELLPSPPRAFYVIGSVLAVVFLVGGLIASFFHLGHPERAWRSAARWRTSWLSREVIVLPAVIVAALLYGLAHHYGWRLSAIGIDTPVPADFSLAVGAGGVVAVFLLFLCTGMIYACIKFLQEWATWLTVANYTLFGIASGFLFAAAFAALTAPRLAAFFGLSAAVATLTALVTRGASLLRNARLKHRSSLQTAIGVRHRQVEQKSQGFMGGSFNTREFFHGAPRWLFRAVKWIFLVLVFPVPLALLWLGLARGPGEVDAALLFAAFALQYLGLIAERWFFFAQANHPQNLYYQAVS